MPIISMNKEKDMFDMIKEGHVVLVYIRHDEPGQNNRHGEPQYRQQLSVVHFQCVGKIMLVAIDIFGNFMAERTFVCKPEDIVVEGEPDTSTRKKFYIKALTEKGRILRIEDILNVTMNINERVRKIQTREQVREISENEKSSIKKKSIFTHFKKFLSIYSLTCLLLGVTTGLLIGLLYS